MKTKSLKPKPASEIYNVLFCGTGGQGVLTAAEIAAIAAMNAGYHVKKSEVHGMAQRGGSVESHLRFGNRIFSPLIGPKQADYLVCFHEGEGLRMSSYLKKGGVSLLPFLTNPQTRPTDKRFINTFFLGFLSAFLPMTEDTWKSALTGKLKRSIAENLQAFGEGRNAGLQSATPKNR
jgi:indolepyruvate ferredoxin oxidoreductase beta subunit